MTSTDTCYLTVTQAAEAAGYSRAHFYRLVLQGRISGAVKIGRDWLIPTPVTVIHLRHQ